MKKPAIIMALCLVVFALSVYGQEKSGTYYRYPPAFSFMLQKPVYYHDKVAVLLYHHINNNESGTTISPEHFRQQVRLLKSSGFNAINLKQFSAFLDNSASVPPNAILITFDDGYDSVYRYAYPTLLENHWPAAIFLIVKHIGTKSEEIPKLSWAEIEQMQKSGFEFQSHTYDSHHLIMESVNGRNEPALTTLQYLPELHRDENEAEYANRISHDLLLSKNILEKSLHNQVEYLALPYGAQNEKVDKIAWEAGFKYLLTTESGIIDGTTTPANIKRINAGQAELEGEALERLILSYVQAPLPKNDGVIKY